MPWTMDDYPQSWKNLDTLERKKAIDIGNAMLKDGYQEDRVIPIATKQAESWYKDASENELKALKHKKIKKHEKDNASNPKLNEKDVHVYFEDNVWKIKSDGAKQASDSFDKKEDAMKRARNIADNRSTEIIEHKKDE
ncbi:DUF2188 domain-containing protein [Staphylococcus sp. ACRSN]|uniref:DUF2188 domain-containing protein n=1 Tax=Staphylococcus sp. ACRSN TaxID=2918214 RepID=UPI001EF17E5F|nr:DUF2188 domain-containing protein [Staphylococcus sp. ACRSN]MCG7338064.1 DUF2188 domain-containing protein [Staphylococcus sp. ACRSN]